MDTDETQISKANTSHKDHKGILDRNPPCPHIGAVVLATCPPAAVDN